MMPPLIYSNLFEIVFFLCRSHAVYDVPKEPKLSTPVDLEFFTVTFLTCIKIYFKKTSFILSTVYIIRVACIASAHHITNNYIFELV